MIRIKAVDAQNLLDVCKLTTHQNGMGANSKGCPCCNAEIHPNAIYHNHVLIGFFLYQRAETQADTATICRFMLDSQFQQKGLEEKAFEHILRGLKIQGVRNVIFLTDDANEEAKNLSLSFGFQFTGKSEHNECCYALAL